MLLQLGEEDTLCPKARERPVSNGARIKTMQSLFLACPCFNLSILSSCRGPGDPSVCLSLKLPLVFADLLSVYRNRHLQRDGSC